jgi:hypothetical protein
MNKEQQELLDEAYERYLNGGDIKWLNQIEINTPLGKMNIPVPYSQEEFINKCKIDTEFSERWGLKIEERELSLEERYQIAIPIWKEKYGPLANMMVPTNVDNTPYKIPTKLITVTYNNETIESYENNS